MPGTVGGAGDPLHQGADVVGEVGSASGDELVDAARSRDPERVRGAVRVHLENNLTTMLEGLSALTGD